jgi:hypothetical protein
MRWPPVLIVHSARHDSKAPRQFPGPHMRNPHDPRLPPPRDPTHLQHPRKHRRAQRACKVRPSLRPIQAPPRKRPPRLPQAIHIHSQFRKPAPSISAQFVFSLANNANHLSLLQCPSHLHRDPPREMVVARSRDVNLQAQPPRNRARRARTRCPGHRSRCNRPKRLDRVRHVRTRHAVIPMPPRTLYRQQAAIDQLRKMSTRRLRRNIRDHRQFPSRPCPPVQQCNQNRRPRRISDQLRNNRQRIRSSLGESVRIGIARNRRREVRAAWICGNGVPVVAKGRLHVPILARSQRRHFIRR